MIAFTAVALAGISLESPAVVGTETILAIVDAQGDPRGGETVRVVHRPGLGGEQELAVGITDGRGRVRWTPRTAGVAWLRAGEEILPLRIDGPGGMRATAMLVCLLVGGGVGALGYGTALRRQ